MIAKTYWETHISTERRTYRIPRAKKLALDLSLGTAGAIFCWGIGSAVGEAMDHIPYISQWIPQAVDHISGINVKDNLNGLVGILGGDRCELLVGTSY